MCWLNEENKLKFVREGRILKKKATQREKNTCNTKIRKRCEEEGNLNKGLLVLFDVVFGNK